MAKLTVHHMMLLKITYSLFWQIIVTQGLVLENEASSRRGTWAWVISSFLEPLKSRCSTRRALGENPRIAQLRCLLTCHIKLSCFLSGLEGGYFLTCLASAHLWAPRGWFFSGSDPKELVLWQVCFLFFTRPFLLSLPLSSFDFLPYLCTD